MFEFLSNKFSEKNISKALTQVKEALLGADVPHNVINDFLSQISQETLGQKLQTKVNPSDQFVKIVNDKLVEFLGGKNRQETISFQYPSVVLVMGLQGSGKTTTVAKLANWVKKEAKKRGKNRRILVASVDFYRPAAVEQLNILADQVGVDFYKSTILDPLQASKEIYAHFKKNCYEILFLDTAGRLHIDDNMMEELKSINNIVKPF